jgi:hypothetical protein
VESNNPRQKITEGHAGQAPFAHQIKKAVGDKLLIAIIGAISRESKPTKLLKQALKWCL